MNRRLILPLLLPLSLGACTTTGKLATSANGPVDWAVTVKNGCNALKVTVGVVDAVYAGDPKIFGNDANYQVYVGVKKTLLDTCGPTPPVDLQSAAANLLLAATDTGALISTLKSTGVVK